FAETSCANPAALRTHVVAHLAVFGTDSANSRIGIAITVADWLPLHGFQAGMLDHRRGLFDHFQIGLLKDNFLAGALATRLFAGLLRPADNSTLAECVKAVHQN